MTGKQQTGAKLLVECLLKHGLTTVFGIPGAKGYEVKKSEDLLPILRQALTETGPVLIAVPIDYRDNQELFVSTNKNIGN